MSQKWYKNCKNISKTQLKDESIKKFLTTKSRKKHKFKKQRKLARRQESLSHNG